MNAEVVSIGTELLLGEIVDTNSAYIARQLRDIGVNLYCITMVGFPGIYFRRKGTRALARRSPVPPGSVALTKVMVLPS